MSTFVFTPAAQPDPILLGRYQAALAKLRPACSRCGKNLTARERRAGRTECFDRTECTLISIFRGSVRGADIAGFRALCRHQAERAAMLAGNPAGADAAAGAARTKGGHMAGTTEKKPTAREVAVDILREKGGGPIKVTELAKAVVASGKTKLTGKTPEATVSAHIYTAAAKGVLFKKTGRGEVELLPDESAPAAEAKTSRSSRKAPAAAAEGEPKKSRGGRAKKAGEPAAAPARKSRGGRKAKPPATDDVAAGDAEALAAADGADLVDQLLEGAGAAAEQTEAEEREPAAVG